MKPEVPKPLSPLPCLRLGAPRVCSYRGTAFFSLFTYFQSVVCSKPPASPTSTSMAKWQLLLSLPPSAFGAARLQPPNLQSPTEMGPGLQAQIWRLDAETWRFRLGTRTAPHHT